MAFANQRQFDAFIDKLKAWKAEGNTASITCNGRIRSMDRCCPLEIAAKASAGAWLDGRVQRHFDKIFPAADLPLLSPTVSQYDIVRAADCSDLLHGYPEYYSKLNQIRCAILDALGIISQ